jgi:hypothetical protein
MQVARYTHEPFRLCLENVEHLLLHMRSPKPFICTILAKPHCRFTSAESINMPRHIC